MRRLPAEQYVSIAYEYYTKKKLNLKSPEEFNAKIQWYKLYFRPKMLNQLVDKYAVREYVEDKIGGKYLNEIYGVYESEKDIDLDFLPNDFVLKGTHGSGFNLIVNDKNKISKSKINRKCKKWLRRNYYYKKGREWAYKDVKPRVMAEKMMYELGRDSLTDYKFYCFDGIPKFVEIHIDRVGGHKRGFYDLEFNKLPFKKQPIKKFSIQNFEKPENFEEMINLAKCLAGNLPFVRVDFYSVNNKSIFGEMTFYPGDGTKDFYPEEYNKQIGDYFKLPQVPKGEKYITNF